MMGERIADVLTDEKLRNGLSKRAESRARSLTWDAVAAGVLRPLHEQVVQRSSTR